MPLAKNALFQSTRATARNTRSTRTESGAKPFPHLGLDLRDEEPLAPQLVLERDETHDLALVRRVDLRYRHEATL
jgi:hypothetical protein